MNARGHHTLAAPASRASVSLEIVGGRAARSRRFPESAFSLVEVMVAILVLGVALVGLAQGVTLALQSSKESELQTTAALFAAGQIETLRAEGGLQDGETEGDCGEGLTLYRWKETISRTALDGLHEVGVTVENAKSGKAIYELQTLLFEAPDEAGAATGPDGNRRRKEPGGR